MKTFYQRYGKRLFDLLVSFFGILLFFPLFLIIGLLIFIDSGWPIFFCQKRVGKQGIVFTMFKFRTMVKTADRLKKKYFYLNEAKGPVFKIRDDPRFTKFGKKLARKGLDELPQLVNVFWNKMSLVGPRPLSPDEEKNIKSLNLKFRKTVLPGIISEWIVVGVNNLDYQRRLELDNEYVKNINFSKDIRIVLGSVFMILKSFKVFADKEKDFFSSVGIHQTMLEDKIRTLAYKKAIEANVNKTDVVLDMGCGTGILSFFAAKKGCKKVYAIDNSKIIEAARETAKLNGLDKKITFIKEDVLKLKIKGEIDVLIHEQIGSFIWNEGFVSKVVYIRDNFLKKEGKIIPDKVDLYLVPTTYKSDLMKSKDFWLKKRYEIDFSNLWPRVLKQKSKESRNPVKIFLKDTKTFLCKEKLVYRMDLRKESEIRKKITTVFKLKKGSKLRGMCGFFVIHLDKNHTISTRPKRINTHWGQFFLPCFKGKVIKQDSILRFTLLPDIKLDKWRFSFKIKPA